MRTLEKYLIPPTSQVFNKAIHLGFQDLFRTSYLLIIQEFFIEESLIKINEIPTHQRFCSYI